MVNRNETVRDLKETCFIFYLKLAMGNSGRYDSHLNKNKFTIITSLKFKISHY